MAADPDARNWLDLAGPVDPAVIAPPRLFVASAAIVAAVAAAVVAVVAVAAIVVAVAADAVVATVVAVVAVVAVAIAIGAPVPAQAQRELHFAALAAQGQALAQGQELAQLVLAAQQQAVRALGQLGLAKWALAKWALAVRVQRVAEQAPLAPFACSE